ncbi:MAG: efflux transporter outer membrane subunit, partial [Pseudomonadota bacterium]|nr:efflux transporter outer membrane subunit [Pseudomonadota bacterium]
NALFLLMGVPQDNSVLPKSTLDEVTFKDGLDSGLPSEILLMRPDVKQAEYELLARNADIGAARAAFFPSISLTGTYGFASQSLSNLFTGGAAGAWAFLPQITLPIFQGGRNQANLDLAEIRKEKAVLNYEKAIQTAFREVSDELAARETLDGQLQAQRRLVEAAETVYSVSEARYKSGIDSFLSVLDAQRELYAYQQNEIQIELQRQTNLVNLYKVLGGGSY